MAQIRTPAEASDPASSHPHEESPSQPSSRAAGAIFLSIVGLKTWDEVTVQYPTQALLAMAAGMTIPMVAWMLFRGMGRRNAYEMAAAMVLPVVPFLCLVWFDVTQSAWCGAYCATTIVPMLLLMRYRRSTYSMRCSGSEDDLAWLVASARVPGHVAFRTSVPTYRTHPQTRDSNPRHAFFHLKLAASIFQDSPGSSRCPAPSRWPELMKIDVWQTT